MVVQYTHKIASGSGFLSFFKLLRRWRGSVYKVVWQDMLVYLILYYTISCIYRFGLPAEGRALFEKLVIHVSRFRNLIPVSFVLGFYVSLVVGRWWETYKSFPWPDNTAVLISTHIQGLGQEARMVRETVMRYVILCIALTFRKISPVVREKYETLSDLSEDKYLTAEEVTILEKLEKQSEQQVAWVPIMWACRIVEHSCRVKQLVTSDLGRRGLVAEMLKVRAGCGALLGYDANNIPLVYAQVVSIAVYAYFVFSLIGEQFLDPAAGYPDHVIDVYVPFITILQIFFYIGWLKVAEALLNPFGDDDHDFEFLSLLDRHYKISTQLVKYAPEHLPSPVNDISKQDDNQQESSSQDLYPSLTPDAFPHDKDCLRYVCE